MQRKFLHRAFCVLSCAAIAGGCGKKHIQTVADGPALAMPAPPSRVFAPIEDEEPLAAGPAPDTKPTQAPNATPTPTRPARPREPERTEQSPTPAPAPTPAIEAPRELRAASSPSDPEAEKKISELIKRASSTLGGVYYQGLSTQRRELYEQAKGFIIEAEKAMKERKDFLYAETLAGKAEKLATELLGR